MGKKEVARSRSMPTYGNPVFIGAGIDDAGKNGSDGRKLYQPKNLLFSLRISRSRYFMCRFGDSSAIGT